MSRKLPRSFYDRPTLEVARDLLGSVITFRTKQTSLSARIVEVEAYVGQDDPACHAAGGLSERNRVMFDRPGFSYIYFIYGMYHCFNIVTEKKGFPAAVLLRAAEPVDGIESMRERSPKGIGLTRDHSGVDLTESTLYLTAGEGRPGRIVTTTRIGIKTGTELPYRFYLAESEAVSGSK